MARRGILDERTRCLVLVGQFLLMDEPKQLSIHIRNALRHATPREVLEVILQATVYLGYPKIIGAARVFTSTLKELGRLDEITETQLPLDGHKRSRSLVAERKTWGVSETDFPRREEMLRKFGWEGLSTGFRLQPSHHHKTVAQLDRVDQHFLKLWLDYIYAGMYARRILDDRTRILCVIGELFVMGEFVQIENHIRNALVHGATPREVLEVILQSTIYAGMPRFVRVVSLLQRILEEDGRLGELTDTQLPLP
jgi:alkylhydroperoxidase/carboxymuconolactone decarboxylase family protein YurZ